MMRAGGGAKICMHIDFTFCLDEGSRFLSPHHLMSGAVSCWGNHETPTKKTYTKSAAVFGVVLAGMRKVRVSD